jgi:nucleotide-binding universal stress UspA family protein
MSIFKKILVGVDGSDDSYEAVDYAIKIAESMKSKLIFLYIITENYIKEVYKGEEQIKKSISQVDDIMLLQARTEAIGKAIFQRIEDFIKERKITITYEFKMRNGNPANEIIEEVNQNGYDLCILGAKSASRSFTTVFGKISDHVIRNTKIPILMVRV